MRNRIRYLLSGIVKNAISLEIIFVLKRSSFCFDYLTQIDPKNISLELKYLLSVFCLFGEEITHKVGSIPFASPFLFIYLSSQIMTPHSLFYITNTNLVPQIGTIIFYRTYNQYHPRYYMFFFS
jgi:hypothetical protein